MKELKKYTKVGILAATLLFYFTPVMPVMASSGQSFVCNATGQTGTLQSFTAPSTGTYTIEADGAQGGSETGQGIWIGGAGVKIKGDFTLTQGEVLTILVGGQGQSGYSVGGGGGGSYVYTGTTPLIIAGGGGGGGVNTSLGTKASYTTAAAGGVDKGPSTVGYGGLASTYQGSAGAGWLSDGASSSNGLSGGGADPSDGGAGGISGSSATGGYGGGGGGLQHYDGYYGGGGGGYTGGPDGCGGAGSYNSGINQSQIGYNTGNGLVIITSATVTYSVSTSAQAGTGTTSGGGLIISGNSANLTATPATGYSFVSWTLGGIVKSTSASYTTPAITANASYVANFALSTYNVSTSTGAGSGTTNGGGTINYGSTTNLIATPSTGYSFINWTLNGVGVSTSATYTTPAIIADTSYVANFVSITPSSPSDITASNITPTSITLSWTAVANASSYKIYKNSILDGTSTTPSYTDALLQQSTPYSFSVSACNLTLESDQSLPLLITTSQQLNSIQQTPQTLKLNVLLTDGTNYYDPITRQTYSLSQVTGLSVARNSSDFTGDVQEGSTKIMIVH